jgi:hypothetical protein
MADLRSDMTDELWNDGPEDGLTYFQRLYGALSDLADIEAVKDDVSREEIGKIIDFWSTDPPMEILEDGEGIILGPDQMKLYAGMTYHNVSEEEIERNLFGSGAIEELLPEEEVPEVELDQVDHMIADLDAQIDATGSLIAYLTAVLSDDSQSAHQLISEEGCRLVHVLTSTFIFWILAREVLPEGEDDLATLREWISGMALETAKFSTISPGDKREKIERAIEQFRGMNPFDQDED